MINNATLETHIEAAIRAHNIAVENLTERQLCEAFKQALLSGDFVRYVQVGSDKQSVVYIPFAGQDCLREKIADLEKELATANSVLAEYETTQTWG